MIPHIEKIGALRKMLHERDAIAQTIVILEELGNIDELIEEARKRIEGVREEEVTARNAAQQALVDLDLAKQAIEAARAEASAILSNANVEAGTVIANAQREAEQIRNLAAETKEDARKAVAAAHQEREGVLGEINARRAELAEIEARIDQARAAARAAFGG